MNRLKEFWSLTKQDGIRQSSWLALRFSLRKTIALDWLKATILRRPLEKPTQDITPKIKIEIRQVSENDLIKFKGIVDDEKLTSFHQRFDEGKKCFIALDKDNIAGYCWISFQNEYNAAVHTEIKLNDKIKEAYIFDAFVMPEYRNNKLQTALFFAEMKYALSLGYTGAAMTVHDDNTYSIRAARAAGFEPSESVTYITIFGLKFHRWHSYT